ncbi:MAG: transcriptional regulator, family protein [Frankiales bacterium]|nr:transcriptional regulator, family protein [Frankiales bacterium]
MSHTYVADTERADLPVTTSERVPPVVAHPSALGLCCVEVGASSVETVLLGPGSAVQRLDGLHPPDGRPLLLAVPGLVHAGRVVAASNLGWYDVDPAEQLGLPVRAAVVCNDAEAAALGESALRPGAPDLVFVGLGTGVGGAVVTGGVAEANLFAHGGRFGDRPCGCGRVGCLETVAGGWALPAPLTAADLPPLAAALAQAIEQEPRASPRLVVLAGGITTAHPHLVPLLAAALPERTVQPTAAATTKSATAWGLRHLHATGTARPRIATA